VPQTSRWCKPRSYCPGHRDARLDLRLGLDPGNRTSMVVCMGQEPASLAWWKTDLVSAHVLEAIYDGGIDNRSYAYQPVGTPACRRSQTATPPR